MCTATGCQPNCSWQIYRIVTKLICRRYGVRILPEARDVSRFQNVQNSLRSHGSFPPLKRPGRKVDQSPISSADVKNEWSYTATSLIYLQGAEGDSFNFCVQHAMQQVSYRSAHHTARKGNTETVQSSCYLAQLPKLWSGSENVITAEVKSVPELESWYSTLSEPT
jgi:hypothetical protein